jgi:lantibiotic transport system ATP-binding protein
MSLKAAPVVKLDNISFSYAHRREDISELSLHVEPGSVYGFLGHNGAGKTTTIRLILGLLKPLKGSVSLFGKPFVSNRLEVLKEVGALIEHPSLYGHLNAYDNLRITALYRNVGRSRVEEVLDIVGLLRDAKRKTREYSTGMKQRLGLAIALLGDPGLLILDEPTNGLDPKGILEMRQLLVSLNRDHGKTIFLSSHLLSEVEKICTHVGIIKKGKILFNGKIGELKTNEGSMRIRIETSNREKAASLLQLGDPQPAEELLRVSITDKSQISKVIDTLRKEDVEVYQVRIENNLEETFLSLTEK